MNQGLNSEDISNSMIILMFMSLFSNKNEKALPCFVLRHVNYIAFPMILEHDVH